MHRVAHRIGQALRAALLALLLPAALCAVQAEAMPPGIAVVTSQQGAIQIHTDGSPALTPQLHQTLRLSGATIETGRDAHLFLALSNGVGIGLTGGTSVQLEHYRQRPFSAKKQSIAHEPSISELSLRILKGSIALCTKRLSPLSQASVELAQGKILIHSAICIVRADAQETEVTACEGSVTYYDPRQTKRKFVVGPERLHIRSHNSELKVETHKFELASLPQDLDNLAAATELASQRVFFQAGGADQPPHPQLIVPADYFEQPAARAYQFKQ